VLPGTHLLIARIAYEHIVRKTGFLIDYPSFAYGSIKPDINKNCICSWHTFEDSMDILNTYADELIECKVSAQDFSEALGVICHFVCDYFCLHHGREYWKKDPIAHGIYEVKLHLRLLKLYRNGCLKINYKYKQEKSLKDVIVRLRRKYKNNTRGMEADIYYAIIAAISACNFIISVYHKHLSC
jgi:hypothetical protein